MPGMAGMPGPCGGFGGAFGGMPGPCLAFGAFGAAPCGGMPAMTLPPLCGCGHAGGWRGMPGMCGGLAMFPGMGGAALAVGWPGPPGAAAARGGAGAARSRSGRGRQGRPGRRKRAPSSVGGGRPRKERSPSRYERRLSPSSRSSSSSS
ncbi:unnamed protein product [Prorocentrum cordatum]|uniref:Uncharacterized protein n=1 Tax=Prorocentrum cordatum TaxID=2364126 RepID=A0ABN9SI96_9DINO|nr:unnamed protein product [Polarella glacialis]